MTPRASGKKAIKRKIKRFEPPIAENRPIIGVCTVCNRQVRYIRYMVCQWCVRRLEKVYAEKST